MDNIIKIDPMVLALIENAFSNNQPKPFVKEIFLIQSHIAGTAYLNLNQFDSELNVDDSIVFIREPDNKHDQYAISLYDSKGNKLGYIPRDKNQILANLLDAGKLVFGKLAEKNWKGEWLKITIKVYLKDL